MACSPPAVWLSDPPAKGRDASIPRDVPAPMPVPLSTPTAALSFHDDSSVTHTHCGVGFGDSEISQRAGKADTVTVPRGQT